MMPLHDETLARVIEAERTREARAIAVARSVRRVHRSRTQAVGRLAGLRLTIGMALIRAGRRLSTNAPA
jgi:hypothetical protein